jgi:quinohemoprotein ethanol dehydrogenase
LDAADGELISATPFTNQNWTTGQFDENGRPELVEEAVDLALYAVVPGPTGAHNWHPMAFNPDTGLVYIPVNEIPFFYDKTRNVEDSKSFWNIGYDAAAGWPVEYPAGTLDAVSDLDGGSLLAWDPVKAEPRWAVPFPLPLNGGVLSTQAGLVFQGNKFGEFVAYDAETGERLWADKLVGNAAAAPMTYEIDGEQYLSVLSGWGSVSSLIAGFTYGEAKSKEPARVITFKLGGDGDMPAALVDNVVRRPQSPMFGEPDQHQLGMQRFAENCHFCHGAFAVSGGVVPDLRWSALSANEQAWDLVVREGALEKQGMVSFAGHLSKEDTDAIRAYVVQQAWLAVANGDALPPQDG